MPLLKYSPEHEIFRTQIKNFVEKEVRPFVEKWEQQGKTDRALWKRCGEMGFLGITYPESLGGMGADHFFSQVFVEEMSQCGSSGVILGLIVQTHMATPALVAHGSDFLKEKYLKPAILGDKICAIAVTEPNCGSDVAGLETRAVLQGDHYLVSGSKMFITNGLQADFLTLLARTSDQPGYGSYSLFVVPTDLPGVSTARALKKTCYLSSDTAEVSLENVKLPKEFLIGTEGKGFKYQMEQFQHERLAIIIMMVGTMKRAYELTKKYVTERTAFGKLLVEHQVTRHKLAQILAELTLVESATYQCVEMATRNEDFTKEVSMLKLTGAQIQQRVLEECAQIHGGYGLMQEYEVARYFRDSKLSSIGGGSSEIMKEIISKIEFSAFEKNKVK
ncbi:MAG: acyl-CoA dehydrogenase family protein [Bdellovibrionota bacterium]